MNITNKKKGFTLLELLVVVSIIALLSVVVIAALNTAKAKGADSAVKADMANLKTQIELYLADKGSYASSNHSENYCSTVAANNIIADPIIQQVLNYANKATGGSIVSNQYRSTKCAAASLSYAIAIALKTNDTDTWCMDSTGTVKQTGTPITSGSVILGNGSGASPYTCGV